MYFLEFRGKRIERFTMKFIKLQAEASSRDAFRNFEIEIKISGLLRKEHSIDGKPWSKSTIIFLTILS